MTFYVRPRAIGDREDQVSIMATRVEWESALATIKTSSVRRRGGSSDPETQNAIERSLATQRDRFVTVLLSRDAATDIVGKSQA